MAPRRTSQPTAAELEILQVVWQRGSASVREVFETLGAEREIGYTTVLKLMQIMHEKEMLTRDASARSHRFTAAFKREATQKEIVGNLIAKAFGGSAAQLSRPCFRARPILEGGTRGRAGAFCPRQKGALARKESASAGEGIQAREEECQTDQEGTPIEESFRCASSVSIRGKSGNLKLEIRKQIPNRVNEAMRGNAIFNAQCPV